MPDEFFDIVDEHNNPLGVRKSRKDVHDQMTDWHRTTNIWIVNDYKEILCQQRSLTKDQNPGKWQSFFGGHLKAGQSYEDNAREELNEELGITVEADELVSVYVGKNDEYRHFEKVYIIRWNGRPDEISLSDGEVDEVCWLNILELTKRISAGDFCNTLDGRVMGYIDGLK